MWPPTPHPHPRRTSSWQSPKTATSPSPMHQALTTLMMTAEVRPALGVSHSRTSSEVPSRQLAKVGEASRVLSEAVQRLARGRARREHALLGVRAKVRELVRADVPGRELALPLLGELRREIRRSEWGSLCCRGG